MLDKNQIFSFERGAYFSGDLRYAIVVNEGRYVFKGEAFNDFYWMDNCEFEIPEKEIEVLKKIVRPVEFWQKNTKQRMRLMMVLGGILILNIKISL